MSCEFPSNFVFSRVNRLKKEGGHPSQVLPVTPVNPFLNNAEKLKKNTSSPVAGEKEIQYALFGQLSR